MIDAMDTQFDKLTTKLNVFVDTIGIGNALTKKMSSLLKDRSWHLNKLLWRLNKKCDTLNDKSWKLNNDMNFLVNRLV